MKNLVTILFLFLSSSCLAIRYYVSPGGTDSFDGQSPATAWKTIAKVNNYGSYLAGDTISFERGYVWYGCLVPKRSDLYFVPYGSGAKPLITGFETLTSWTSEGAGVYSKVVPGADTALMLVAINGRLQRMGRYPNYNAANEGWLNTLTVNDTISFTGPELSSDTSWTGAEVPTRNQHWVIQRNRVTAHSGSTISIRMPVGENTSVRYKPRVGYGHFFQNDLRTLDQFGEWFLNKTTKKLSVYFGASNPSGHTIQVSTLDTLFDCGGKNGRTARSNIYLEDMAFEGGNDKAFFAWDGGNITVKNCDFRNNNDAIYMWNIPNSRSEGNLVEYSLNNGIQQYGRTSNGPTYIINNTVRNTGYMAGMGRSGDGMQIGIRQDGNNAIGTGNVIDSAGYNGFEFQGNNVRISRNYITNCLFVKDDGGLVYTWSNDNKTKYVNRFVDSNILVNAIGATAGTPGPPVAALAYFDGGANGIVSRNNTMVNAVTAAYYLNNATNVRMTGNSIYNVPYSLSMQRLINQDTLLRNITFTSNISYPTKSNIFYWNSGKNRPVPVTIQNDIRAIGTFDSNYVRNDLAAAFDYYYHDSYNGTFRDSAYFSMNLSQWKTFVAQEVETQALSTAPHAFVYNPGLVPLSYAFPGYLKVTPAGVQYSNNVSIPSFSNLFLFANGTVLTPPPGVTVMLQGWKVIP